MESLMHENLGYSEKALIWPYPQIPPKKVSKKHHFVVENRSLSLEIVSVCPVPFFSS